MIDPFGLPMDEQQRAAVSLPAEKTTPLYPKYKYYSNEVEGLMILEGKINGTQVQN